MESKAVADLLLNHGVKPSYPRIQVYKYLSDKRNHPTVDEIYNVLIEEIPTLSKTTVYNTLNLFIEKNIAKSLIFEDMEKKYEIIIDDHSHFKCDSCGHVYDIPYGEMNLLPEGFESFEIEEISVFLRGKCSKCKENQD